MISCLLESNFLLLSSVTLSIHVPQPHNSNSSYPDLQELQLDTQIEDTFDPDLGYFMNFTTLVNWMRPKYRKLQVKVFEDKYEWTVPKRKLFEYVGRLHIYN